MHRSGPSHSDGSRGGPVNPVHIHLILNHVPAIGLFFGVIFLQWGVWRKSADLRKAGLVCFILSALAVVPVFISGGASEEVVEEVLHLPEPLIERHEDSAGVSLAAVVILGFLSFWSLRHGRRATDPPTWLLPAVAVLSLACLALLGRTAWLGGHIRHTELLPYQDIKLSGAGQYQ